MGLRRLLLSVTTLLSLITEGSSEPQYVLSTPAKLNSGETGKLCVNLVECSEHLDLNVVLEYNGKNTTIIAVDVATPTYFACNDYQIPTVPSSVPVAIIFSAIGKTTDMRERKTVVIKPTSNNCLFQMDKPIYKAGQKVLFRVVCLNPQLKAVNEKFPAISLQDPSNTKIAQWLHQESDHGVVSMEFQLISDAVPGSYLISAEREKGYAIQEWFTVKEYVLPRFEVKVESPSSLSVTSEKLKFNASAIYTFGEPVAGSMTVRYCKQPEFYGRRQNCFKDKGGFCSNMTGELGPDGTYTGVIDMFSPSMRSMGRGTSITLDITVTEAGTGIQVTETKYVYVTSQPASLQLEYGRLNQHYKRGLAYPVQAKLNDENGHPMPHQEIDLDVDGQDTQTSITDSDGRVVFQIDTSNMLQPNFTFKVSYKNPDQCYYSEWQDADYPTAEYTVYRFYSQSGSFLQMKHPEGELSCDQNHNIDLQYIFSGVYDGATKATIYFMLLSKSKIMKDGQKDVDLTSSMNGTLSLDVLVCAELAPSADLVVYSILKKEIIADSLRLSVEKCFKNEVSMTFSAENGVPGSNVDVQVSADPNSICGLRVFDSALLLLNAYERFTADTVISSLRSWTYGYNIDGFDVEDPAPQCEDPNKLVFCNGQYYLPVSSESEGDSYKLLREVGLHLATRLSTRKPDVCDNNPPFPIIHPMEISLKESDSAPARFSVGSGGGGAGAVETVRTNFAEAFMWLMLNLNAEGRGTVSEKVPDTITKWQGSAFCLSDEGGFGMTKYPANYTTFLPFFIELTLPYSCVRGETLVVVAIVRNYLEQCVKVQVNMETSNAYNAVQTRGEQNACICSNDRATYTWEVQASKIGEIDFTVSAQTTHISQTCDGPNDSSQPTRKDTVVQSILVEPEGIRRELTLSHLVHVENNNVQLPLSITLPDNVVPDSPSAYVTAVGDIFGLPLRNLQDLVQKPYGCAEQNLARVAPIPHVLEYLNVTGQLTDEILQKAKGYMSEGYYRQLSFTYGGGYNLFRQSKEQGNSWLTAYTFKTLEQCKPYIFIDETRQQQSLIWMENSQRLDNGCFKARGNLFVMEESDNDLYYTAYLAVALMETENSLGKTLLEGSMECLRNASKTEQKITIQVQMLYAFTLAKDWEHSDPLLESLMKKAITEGGTIHWEREQMPKRPWVPFFLPPFGTNEVEITSYMLLSMAARPSISQDELTKMAQIGMWLSRNQNSHGGFISTQSTVLGIQGLAALAKLLYTPNSHHTVAVKRGNGDIASFTLNKDNRLLVQRQPLPDTTGDYSLDVGGLGWCLLQTTVGYNVPVPSENSAFSMEISTSSFSCVNGVAYSINLNISLSYRGLRPDCGMVVAQIRPLSGYTVDFSTLYEMINLERISKAEQSPKGDILLYLDSVPRDPIYLSVQLLMGQRVMNVKSSSAYVFSYYEDDENGYAAFAHPCAGQ